MGGNGTVDEEGVGVVDDLLEDKVLQLKTRGKGRVGSRVARSEFRALGDGVVVSTPDEFDGVADGSIDGEGNVTKDTLGWSDPYDVSLAGRTPGRRTPRGRIPVRHTPGSQTGILGLALLNAVFVRVASPGVTSRTVLRRRVVRGGVGRGRGRLIHRARGTVLVVCGGVGRRGVPGVRRRHLISHSWRGGDVRSGDHAIVVPGMFDQNGEGISTAELCTHKS